MIERKSPGLSAFWATSLMFVILLTQHPIKAMFRGQNDFANQAKIGFLELIQGLIDGARNMIGIGLATATAGVIVGTVSLTGVGQVMADLVEFLSGGNLIAMLVLVGILSLILGMGLPTTANYIVVSTLMVGVVQELGQQNGLIVPLIAVHLFVFYFGIMADVTPPVGLASFAAAAVSGGDAIKTGFVAFFYSLRTVALPFVFIFNTDLLLINVGLAQGILVFVSASIAILVFTSGTMGWFMTKSRIYESVMLILVAFMLFRPDFVMDRIQPPYANVEPSALVSAVEGADVGSEIRVVINGPDFDTSELRDTTILLAIGEEAPAERLTAMGLILIEEGDALILEEPSFSSPHAEALKDYDFYGDEYVTVKEVLAPQAQMPKELVFLPALLLLAFVYFLQIGRVRRIHPEGETA
jgi:hypothetical protein